MARAHGRARLDGYDAEHLGDAPDVPLRACTGRKEARQNRFSDFGASFGNLCAHYITPALVLAQWLFLQDKTGINLWSAVCWLVLPLLYSVFALLRARTGKPIGHTKLIYPYPFLDLEHLGVKRFCLVFLAVLAFFFILGCVLVFIGQALPA